MTTVPIMVKRFSSSSQTWMRQRGIQCSMIHLTTHNDIISMIPMIMNTCSTMSSQNSIMGLKETCSKEMMTSAMIRVQLNIIQWDIRDIQWVTKVIPWDIQVQWDTNVIQWHIKAILWAIKSILRVIKAILWVIKAIL